jgi:hypothetical protein
VIKIKKKGSTDEFRVGGFGVVLKLFNQFFVEVFILFEILFVLRLDQDFFRVLRVEAEQDGYC